VPYQTYVLSKHKFRSPCAATMIMLLSGRQKYTISILVALSSLATAS